MKMYQTVYFHKTTRGVQYLVKDMLFDLLKEYREEPELKRTGLVNFFTNGGALEDYQRLDDSSVLAIVHIAAEQKWGLASNLAVRFLGRDVYKCFELPASITGNIVRNKLERFRESLRNENIYFIEDRISHRNYKQHAVTDSNFLKNILIKKQGEHESLGSVSPLLTQPTARVARLYFRTVDDRDRAQAIFKSL
jgi:HD superfamily phosphohydrolase